MKKKLLLALFFLSVSWGPVFALDQSDRELLIELRTTVREMDKRFDQIDKRMDQMDKHIDQRFDHIQQQIQMLFNFLWIISGIFTAIMVGNFGFMIWDRRTIIRTAKKETIELFGTLRQLAKTDQELARVLKQFNLF